MKVPKAEMVLIASNDVVLSVVVFLDGMAYGLTGPMVSGHIMRNGGNHLILGALNAGNAVARLMSQKLSVQDSPNFDLTRFALIWSLHTYFLTYLGLMYFSSVFVLVACRLIYAIVDQPKMFCSRLVKDSSILDASSVSGLVLGSFISGNVYTWAQTLTHNSLMAASMTLVNIGLIWNLEEEFHSPSRECQDSITSKRLSAPRVPFRRKLKSLMEIDRKRFRYVLLLRGTYCTAVTIYFNKFASLIKHKFAAKPVMIGHTVAYHHMLFYAFDRMVPTFKAKWGSNFFFYPNVFLVTLALAAMCLAPTYRWYLFLCIPMIFARVLADKYWPEYLQGKGQKELSEAGDALAHVVGFLAPLCFGTMCHYGGRRIFYLFLLLPVLIGFSIYQIKLRKGMDEPRQQDRLRDFVNEETDTGSTVNILSSRLSKVRLEVRSDDQSVSSASRSEYYQEEDGEQDEEVD